MKKLSVRHSAGTRINVESTVTYTTNEEIQNVWVLKHSLLIRGGSLTSSAPMWISFHTLIALAFAFAVLQPCQIRDAIAASGSAECSERVS